MSWVTDVCRFRSTSSFPTGGDPMMPRRHWVWRAVLTAGLILSAGCQTRVNPVGTPVPRPAVGDSVPAPGIARVAPSPAPEPVAAPSVRPAPPALRIAPEASTITADDLGLQLLATFPEGAVPDETSPVRW